MPSDTSDGRWGPLATASAVGATLLGLGAGLALPDLDTLSREKMRAEALGNLDGIRTAELAHDAAFDSFVSAGSEHDARAALVGAPRPWAGDDNWTRLGWKPDGHTRGGYWVVARPGGFTAHAVLDADGDGVVAEYLATESAEARLLTPGEVY